MRDFIIAAVTAFPITLAGQAFAQADTDTPTAPDGAWVTDCDAWGTPAICTSTWQAGLHERHFTQSYSIANASDGSVIFSGNGVYRLKGQKVDGFWADSQGAIHPLSGVFSAGTLKVYWGSVDTERGRSSYVFENGGLTVRDSVLTDDGWRQFMQVDYPSNTETTADQ